MCSPRSPPCRSHARTIPVFAQGTGDEPVGGFDKRSLTAITCSLDVAAMFAVLLGIRYLAGLEARPRPHTHVVAVSPPLAKHTSQQIAKNLCP